MKTRIPSPAPPRLARALAGAALIASAGALGGCACPSIGQITQIDLQLDRGPLGDAVWELEVTVDGEPRCTYLVAADDVTVADGAECRGAERARLRTSDPFVISYIAEGIVDGVGLTLTIDGEVAIAGLFEPAYSTTHPQGAFCPDDTDGLIRLQVPEM